MVLFGFKENISGLSRGDDDGVGFKRLGVNLSILEFFCGNFRCRKVRGLVLPLHLGVLVGW